MEGAGVAISVKMGRGFFPYTCKNAVNMTQIGTLISRFHTKDWIVALTRDWTVAFIRDTWQQKQDFINLTHQSSILRLTHSFHINFIDSSI